jgi:hypothetical protein
LEESQGGRGANSLAPNSPAQAAAHKTGVGDNPPGAPSGQGAQKQLDWQGQASPAEQLNNPLVKAANADVDAAKVEADKAPPAPPPADAAELPGSKLGTCLGGGH